MKHISLTFLGVIFVAILATMFTSCKGNEQDEFNLKSNESVSVLQKYANVHNSGLNFIKAESKAHKSLTKNQLEHIMGGWLNQQYNHDVASRIMKEIAPIEESVFNGNIPSLTRTRGNTSTDIAITASNECLSKISKCLNSFKDKDVLDNSSLLDELHAIIIETYNAYIQKCSSETEKQVLAQALGVLYGSIDYWTNSANVEFWSKTRLEKDSDTYSGLASKKIIKKAGKKKARKLSKAEYITVVAAADTAGSFLGAGVASGAAAVAASAAAAAYFDVE